MNASDTTGYGNELQYVILAQGLKGIEQNRLTITADPGLNYQVIYRPTGSTIIDV